MIWTVWRGAGCSPILNDIVRRNCPFPSQNPVIRYVTRGNMAERADEVPVRTLDWPVPAVQHLWLGTGEDDKAKRRRAFLSCLNCDNLNAGLPFMHVSYPVPSWRGICPLQEPHLRRYSSTINLIVFSVSAAIPSHLLLMCTVLRYMLTYSNLTRPFLRRYELDAFLATAVSPSLTDVESTQDIKASAIDSRWRHVTKIGPKRC